MGKLTFGINLSLDGRIGHEDFGPADDLFRYWTRLMHETGGMLWGRKVYELMEPYWPAVAKDPKARPIERDWARKLNAQKKYVVSSTRRDFPWENSFRVEGPLGPAIKALKKRTPRGLMLGSPALATQLHKLGLIDEYLFVVHPKIVGKGPALFVDWKALNLKFVEAKRFKSGVVALRYKRATES